MDKKPLKVKLIAPRKRLAFVPPEELVAEMKAIRPKMLRLPEALHAKLVTEAGERTIKAGRWVSVNEVIVSILESYFEPLGGKGKKA